MNKINVSEKNGQWKGDNVGLTALHNWVRRRLNKPSRCRKCRKDSGTLDLANISQEYKRDIKDWEWLCRKCHMESDGRLVALRISHRKASIRFIKCKICGGYRKKSAPCKSCLHRKYKINRKCTIKGCNKKHKALGMCQKHYDRQRNEKRIK